MTIYRPLLAILFGVSLLACSHTSPPRPETPPVATPAKAMQEARQIVMVSTHNWDSTEGELHRYEYREGQWQETGSPFTVSLGRNGSAWGAGLHPMPQPGPEKQEGDGRSPAGVFALSSAFGRETSVSTHLPYSPMSATHYCMDVPDSPYYNRIIDTRDTGKATAEGSTEPMRLDLRQENDNRYALGIVVEHNPKAEPGKGSCIFMHLWRTAGETTAGCTAMPEAAMRELLDWLDASKRPVLVLLPESEYSRLSYEWRLPELRLIQ